MPRFANNKQLPNNYVEKIIYNSAQIGLDVSDLRFINDAMFTELIKIHNETIDTINQSSKNKSNTKILKRIKE